MRSGHRRAGDKARMHSGKELDSMHHYPITANAANTATVGKPPGTERYESTETVAARPTAIVGGSAIKRVLIAAVMAAALVIAGAEAASQPAIAAAPAVPITLGIHDGAINMCDQSGNQTTPPTAAELAAAISSFTSKYWKALKVFTVRFSPPWDI